jgi:hypothetical protein
MQNMVERFFRDLSENRLRHEGFASAADILAKVTGVKAALARVRR